MTGSVGAYVAQVDRVLAAGQGLFPASTGPGSVGGGGEPAVPPAPPRSGLNVGAAGAGEDYRANWRGVTALDAQTNGGAADGRAENERGQAGATGVRQTAQSQAAAIAPATGSPAGVKLLVSSMDERLAAMQREIETTKAQNRLLATRLRQIAAAYRSAAPMTGMGGASALGGMGGAMGGLRGLGGGGMPNLGALSAPMSALSRLSGFGNQLASGAAGGGPAAGMPAGGGPVLTRNSSPRQVAARILWEAHRRGYSRQQAIAILSTAMQESGLNPRAVHPNGLWESIFQQDSSYPGRRDPNTNISEFFNRLDRKGGPGSTDIWKSIFWLQQRPGEPSADAAVANGRKGYLVEIQSQLMPATRLYNELTAA
ncbi:hypothetical protein [Mycobacterium sp. 29Ha]|uniref:hypothetical protein n=1 Tax=Mycobacterium sp. 29Ha TaxID=2939268 RepID=UPI0029394657|nr:hypothetical protein [Mycobacterium sp. 29Ha]MDV3133299.1 hypothetical protein [Mycobacterium sp. 29Ha]